MCTRGTCCLKSPQCTHCVEGSLQGEASSQPRDQGQFYARAQAQLRPLLWGNAMHTLGPSSAAASCLPSFTQTAYKEQAHPTSPHPNSGPGSIPSLQGSPTPSSIPSPNQLPTIVSKASELRVPAQGMQEPQGKKTDPSQQAPAFRPNLSTCTQKQCFLPPKR